jgi:hypothetical protein
MATAITENIRNALNKNSVATAIVLIIIIVSVLIFAAYSLGYLGGNRGREPATMNAFFMDEETGMVEIRLASEIPPLIGKSGKPTVVLARFFTSSSDDSRKLIYLERCTPEVKLAVESARSGPTLSMEASEALHHGTQVRAPEPNSPWYSAESRDGQAVMNAVSALNSDAGKVRAVLPK